MALLAVISAVVAIISGLIIAVGKAVTLPSGLNTALAYGMQLIVSGFGFMRNLFSDNFWNFVTSGLAVVLAAHLAYFAYSLGMSIWRIFQGGGE